jgi:hypothetical protein
VALPGAVVPIAVGDVINGALEDGDVPMADGRISDNYVIQLTAGLPVTIVARGGTALGTGGSLDMYLYLSRDGVDLAFDDDSAGSLNSRIVFTPTETGPYVVRVTTYGSGLHRGQYTLQTYPGALYTQQ